MAFKNDSIVLNNMGLNFSDIAKIPKENQKAFLKALSKKMKNPSVGPQPDPKDFMHVTPQPESIVSPDGEYLVDPERIAIIESLREAQNYRKLEQIRQCEEAGKPPPTFTDTSTYTYNDETYTRTPEGKYKRVL